MWAGNQPFHQQPKITMVDSGGNIIQSDSITEIRAYTVTSLAQNSDIIVDTSTDPIPRIISVQFHESIINGSKMVFSPGDRIPVSVQFSSDVSVTLQSSSNYSNLVPPMLTLNVNDGSPFSFAKAVFFGSEGHTSKVLTFEYTVYDVHNQFPVNYLNIGDVIVEAQKKKIKSIKDLEDIVNKALKSDQKTILIVIYNGQNQRRYIGVKLD